jgi:hypothetical protein
MEPWDIQAATPLGIEISPSTKTLSYLIVRKETGETSRKFELSQFSIRPEWQIMSKAFSMSNNIVAVDI